MSKYRFFVGIDLSKATFDVSLRLDLKLAPMHQQFENSSKGFKAFFQWLKQHQVSLADTLFLMEHTGIYGLKLCYFLEQNKLVYKLLNPLELKKSLGIVRQKTDQADAHQISRYGYLHQEEIIPTRLPSATLLHIKTLLTHRSSLIKQRTAIKNSLHRLKEVSKILDTALLNKQLKSQLKLLKEQVKEVEQQLGQLLKSDKDIQANHQLLQSIPGVGLLVAATMLVTTNNFQSFDNGRQFACYVGAAPFAHISGSSIKGKTKVHPVANRQIKALLTNSAGTVIQHDEQMRNYYQRKLKEGKSKMSVLNAIRCKIINRIFAVIKRGTKYTKQNNIDLMLNLT